MTENKDDSNVILADCSYGHKFGTDWGKEVHCYNNSLTCILCKRCRISNSEAIKMIPYIMLKNKEGYDEKKYGNILKYTKTKMMEERIETFLYEIQF